MANGTASTFFNVGAVDCKLTPNNNPRTLSHVYKASAFRILYFLLSLLYICITSRISAFPFRQHTKKHGRMQFEKSNCNFQLQLAILQLQLQLQLANFGSVID